MSQNNTGVQTVNSLVLRSSSEELLAIDTLDLLEDIEGLKSLELATLERQRLFDNAVGFLNKLESGREYCILLDTDVIRKYINISSAQDHETAFIKHFFEHSTLKYGIPLGTFQEICTYIAKAYPRVAITVSSLLDLVKREKDEQDPMRLLAVLLGYSQEVRGEQVIPDDAIEKMSERLNTSSFHLRKLLFILTNSRFVRKVFTSYHDESYHFFFNKLNSYERRLTPSIGARVHVGRQELDTRDAMNMAIAAESIALNNTNKAGPRFFLLTTTRVVIDVANDFKGAVFAVFPHELLIPDCLGFSENLFMASVRARAISKALRKLDDIFIELCYHKSDRTDPASMDYYASAAKRLSVHVQTLFSRGFRRLDALCDPIFSNDASLAETVPEQLTGATLKLINTSISYRKILQRLELVLHDLAQCEEPEIIPDDSLKNMPYKEYRVNQKLGSRGLDSIGELIIRRFEHDSGDLKFWSANWSIDCNEVGFLLVLDEVYPINKVNEYAPPSSNLDSESFAIGIIDTKSPLWKLGIVVTTCDKNYGLPLSFVSKQKSWTFLMAVKLKQLIRDIDPGSAHPDIQEIRLNLPIGDFIFDIHPSEWNETRMLTVITEQEIYGIVAQLYDRLGSRLARYNSVRNAIEKLTKKLAQNEISIR